MVARENAAPLAVMQAQGSVLTDKNAAGHPGRRYYGGCEHVDVVVVNGRTDDVIAAALRPSTDDAALAALRGRVTALAARHPLDPSLVEAGR